MAYVARYTNLHPKLWAPYKIIAYPHGFMGAHGEPDLPPVWQADARVISRDNACVAMIEYDAATLDDAISACWAHYAQLGA